MNEKRQKILAFNKKISSHALIAKAWSHVAYEIEFATCINKTIELLSMNELKYAILLLYEQFGSVNEYLDYLPFIRKCASFIPIIVVTEHYCNENFQKALVLGADDYISEDSSHLKEIATALSWKRKVDYLRGYSDYSKEGILETSLGINLDLISHKVSYLDSIVSMTRLQFDFTKLLLSQPGKVFSYRQIYEQVWHLEHDKAANKSIQNVVSRIRELDIPDFIMNEREIGYWANA